MKYCDINCDMGEGIGNDELIMPYITSANIACGYHAGNFTTMRETVLLAKKFNVNIGAHPSFDDSDNFGRTEINLSSNEIYKIVIAQIKTLQSITLEYETKLIHVKPHGALYNMAAREQWIAETIALATKECSEDLILFGLSNSHLISEGKKVGLETRSEVFADRTFSDTGSLTPRTQRNALITTAKDAIKQALTMVNDHKVKTVSGKFIPIIAETICIHGDGIHAVEFAKALQDAFLTNDIITRL